MQQGLRLALAMQGVRDVDGKSAANYRAAKHFVPQSVSIALPNRIQALPVYTGPYAMECHLAQVIKGTRSRRDLGVS